jgi:ribosomal protein L37AE/L43A
MEHDLWRQQYEEIKAKENGHGNGSGSNGHVTPEELSLQPGADDSRFSPASWPKSLGKVMTAVPETQVCTNLECGNPILARYGDGAWRCNACQWARSVQGEVGMKPQKHERSLPLVHAEVCAKY